MRRVVCGIEYELTRKRVKNINLRIKQDGRVYVSAGPFVPIWRIEAFIASKAEFIERARRRLLRDAKALSDCFADEDVPKRDYSSKAVRSRALSYMTALCEAAFPPFSDMGIAFPIIKVRNMKTQWGSCRPREGILTFNTKLLDVPRECAEYVVVHEFAHFIHPNHSKDFYELVAHFVPDYKERRKRMKKYILM